MTEADLDREHGALLLAEKRTAAAYRAAVQRRNEYARHAADAYQNPDRLKVEEARIVFLDEPLATEAEMIQALQEVARLDHELTTIRQRIARFS